MDSRLYFRSPHDFGSPAGIRGLREPSISQTSRILAARRSLFDLACRLGLGALLLLAGAAALRADSGLPPWLEQCGPAAVSTDETLASDASADRELQCDAPINLQILLTTTPIQAARDTPPAVCVPADSETSLQRIAEIFHGYASQYQETLYENPYLLLIEALEQQYPCRTTGQPSSSAVADSGRNSG